MALSTPLLDMSVPSAPINNTDIRDRIICSDTFGYTMRTSIEMTLYFGMFSIKDPKGEVAEEDDG